MSKGKYDEQVSVPAYLTLLWIVLTCYVVWHIWYFHRRRNFQWHSYPTIFLSYFTSLGVLLIVPLDVATTVVSRRTLDTEGHYDDHVMTLRKMYLSFYIPQKVLGSVILLFQEYYILDGHFTVWSRLSSAFKTIMTYNIGYAVMGSIFFGILVGAKVVPADGDAVLLVVVLVSNTVGLCVLMVLLGYGLIEFPRMLWNKGDIKMELGRAQHRAATHFKNLGEASLNVSLAVADVMKTKQELAAYADPDLNAAMEILLKECPSEFSSSRMGKLATDKNGKITIESLAALRSRMYKLHDAYDQCAGKVEQTKKDAYYYEDLVEAMNRTDGERKIKWSFKPEGSEVEYRRHIIIFPLLYRALALASVLLSIFSYLGVIGTLQGVSTDVSVYFLAVHADTSTGAAILMFVLVTLYYAAYVTMWSLYQMRIAGYMELVPNHQTNAYSLSVNSKMCANLASPLAFFYLGWLYENGIVQGDWVEGPESGTAGDGDSNTMLTAFAKFYQISVIPVMGGSFNTLFPIIMFSISFLVVTNFWNRLVVYLKADTLQFGSEILTDEQLREGKRQLARHKRTMERAHQRKALRAQINAAKVFSPITNLFASIGLGGGKNDKEDGSGLLREGDPESGGGEGGIRDTTLAEPPNLEGWVDKKGEKKLGLAGGTWAQRYFKVRKPGTLVYFKDKNTEGEPCGQIDLRIVMSFTIPDKDKDKDQGNKDTGVRLDLELADRTFKMRFRTLADAQHWRDGLTLWKDFAIDYGTFFPSVGVEEADAGVDEPYVDYSAQLNDLMIDVNDEATSLTKAPSSSKKGKDSATPSATSTFSPSKSKDSATNESKSSSSKGSKNKDKEVYDRNSDVTAKQSTPSASQQQSTRITTTLSNKPPPLEGWLEKKQNPKMGIATWQKRYFRVDEASGSLQYFKTDNPSEKASGSIDLKLIVDVNNYEKDGKEEAGIGRFTIDMGDRVYKLKAANVAEQDRWMNGINAWREHLLLNF